MAVKTHAEGRKKKTDALLIDRKGQPLEKGTDPEKPLPSGKARRGHQAFFFPGGDAAIPLPYGGGSGYGQYGAGYNKPATKTWLEMGGASDDDIIPNLITARFRSRGAMMGMPLAKAAVTRLCNNVVADGVDAEPNVDWEQLGITEKQAVKTNAAIKRYWEHWFNKTHCDASRMFNGVTQQGLAVKNMLVNGDTPATLPLKPRAGSLFDLRIRMLEADRVANPVEWNLLKNIFGGVELDQEGQVLAYHIRRVHPSTRFLPGMQAENFLKTDRIPAYGALTGRANVLLMMDPERCEQRRGVPFLTTCLILLRKLDQFVDSHLARSVIQTYFTVFIKSQADATGMFSGPSEAPWKEAAENVISRLRPNEVKLAPGIINYLQPGDDVAFADPRENGAQFEAYVRSIVQFLGAALEIPYEVLLQTYHSSYSASRAAIQEFWKTVLRIRGILVSQFLQPVYEELVAEMVEKSFIDAPGFIEDPMRREAWTRCNWSGTVQPSLNPVHDATAAKIKIQNLLSTVTAEARALNGSAGLDNIAVQKREAEAAKAAGVAYPSVETPTSVIQRNEDIQQTGDAAKPGSAKPNPPNQNVAQPTPKPDPSAK